MASPGAATRRSVRQRMEGLNVSTAEHLDYRQPSIRELHQLEVTAQHSFIFGIMHKRMAASCDDGAVRAARRQSGQRRRRRRRPRRRRRRLKGRAAEDEEAARAARASIVGTAVVAVAVADTFTESLILKAS